MYKNILLKVAYDGSGFYGYQDQKALRTVGGTLREAVEKINERKTRLISAGRTDKGVHADGQLVNFLSASKLPAQAYSHLLNKILPEDIYVIESQEIPIDCNIRFASYAKTYRYELVEAPYIHPSYINYMAHTSYKLDRESFYKTSKLFLGKHDFSAFCIKEGDRETIREISDIEIERREVNKGVGTLWTFHIKGDSFLREQVRMMVGAMIRVARGLYEENEIILALESGKALVDFPAAPPQGLNLEKVFWEK